jgi:hypothetical protein
VRDTPARDVENALLRPGRAVGVGGVDSRKRLAVPAQDVTIVHSGRRTAVRVKVQVETVVVVLRLQALKYAFKTARDASFNRQNRL